MKRTHSFTNLLQYPAQDTYFGGLVGLLIGDAMGVPWNYQSPDRLPPRASIELTPPLGFHRSHRQILPGTWSDDGAQALCLLASLKENGRFSLADFSHKLLQWRDKGYMAVDGHVFDIDNQTNEALDRIKSGVPAYESGNCDESHNENGSLMRVLPLALWHRGCDRTLVQDAHLQSLPTHAHPRAMVACAYYCLVARSYMNQHPDPWTIADQYLESIYRFMEDKQASALFQAELEQLRNFIHTDTPRGTGYVLDTIWSVRQAMRQPTFEDVIRTAILFGNDTDSTAAVAGGLAGIRFGLKNIPHRWLSGLRGFSVFQSVTQSASHQD